MEPEGVEPSGYRLELAAPTMRPHAFYVEGGATSSPLFVEVQWISSGSLLRLYRADVLAD